MSTFGGGIPDRELVCFCLTRVSSSACSNCQVQPCLSSLGGNVFACTWVPVPSTPSDRACGCAGRCRLRETIRQSTLEDVFGRYGRVSRCVMRNNGNNSCMTVLWLCSSRLLSVAGVLSCGCVCRRVRDVRGREGRRSSVLQAPGLRNRRLPVTTRHQRCVSLLLVTRADVTSDVCECVQHQH
jgi:hypothetical protein